MRLKLSLATALVASTIASSAAAGSYGGSTTTTKALICLRITVSKTVLVKQKRYYPGVLLRLNKTDADKLVAARKAAILDDRVWVGRMFCLIDANGEVQPDPTETPTTPPTTTPPPVVQPSTPVVTPPADTPPVVVAPPPPAKSPKPPKEKYEPEEDEGDD